MDKMKNQVDKRDHVIRLWRQCWVYASVCQLTLNVFSDINHKLMLYGTTKNLHYEIKDSIDYILSRRPKYVLLPDDEFL